MERNLPFMMVYDIKKEEWAESLLYSMTKISFVG